MSIEAEIREIIESAGAPIRIDELGQPRGTVIGGRRRTPVLVAATVVALVGVAGTIVALNARDRDHARTNSGPEVSVSLPTTLPPSQIVPPQPVAPVGDEYPIHRVNDVEVPTLHGPTAEVIDAASIRFWKTNDDTVMTFRTVRALGDLAVEFHCLGNLDGTGAEYGCSPSAYSPFGPDWLGSSGVGGALGVWQWSNVPADTDFVQYRSGDIVLWQQPVDGLVAFPSTSGDIAQVSATAYRADGATLGTADAASAAAGQAEERAALPQLDHPSLPASREAEQLVSDTFGSCLASNNATIDSPDNGLTKFATLPDSSPEIAWQDCIDTAQHALTNYVATHA